MGLGLYIDYEPKYNELRAAVRELIGAAPKCYCGALATHSGPMDYDSGDEYRCEAHAAFDFYGKSYTLPEDSQGPALLKLAAMLGDK